MTKKVSSKIVYVMTPGTGVLVHGIGHICHIIVKMHYIISVTSDPWASIIIEYQRLYILLLLEGLIFEDQNAHHIINIFNKQWQRKSAL